MLGDWGRDLIKINPTTLDDSSLIYKYAVLRYYGIIWFIVLSLLYHEIP